MITKLGFIKKGWGKEEVLFSSPRFCVKKLIFDKAQARTSLHYHKNKYEEWLVTYGSFAIEWADYDTLTHTFRVRPHKFYKTGDLIEVPTMLAHRIIALERGSTLFETSTMDEAEDSYRISPGDSQQ